MVKNSRDCNFINTDKLMLGALITPMLYPNALRGASVGGHLVLDLILNRCSVDTPVQRRM